MDLVLLLDRKKIADNQKIKEEMEQKRIKECTFRPNISNYYTIYFLIRFNVKRNTCSELSPFSIFPPGNSHKPL